MSHAIRVETGKPIRLDDIPTDADGGLSKERGVAQTHELGAELAELADLLFYAGQHSLLLILQGRDSSGKDGTIRCLLHYCNAQSTVVHPFKVPTERELAHDFLWRVHPYAPGRGEIAVFNRSHYEDVLVVRVHDLVPKRIWERRYDHINHFESLLHDADTIILKFLLHISRDEQEERLLAREQETEKAWKLSVGDWKERERWDEYTAAYEDAVNRCSTPAAPWFVIPADRKWYRNLAVIQTIVETLRPYREKWMAALADVGAEEKAKLDAYRAGASEGARSG